MNNTTAKNYNFGHKKVYIQTVYAECACSSVKFHVKVLPQVTVIKCTCELCKKLQRNHHICQPNRFEILSGKDNLSEYKGPYHENAKNYFCKNCGIHIYFQTSRSTSVCINMSLIDREKLSQVTYVECFQGKNWSQYLENSHNHE